MTKSSFKDGNWYNYQIPIAEAKQAGITTTGDICDNDLEDLAKELKERQQEINAELSILHNADKEFGITLTNIISLAWRAYEIFESSKIEQKRQLINFMFSNLRMNSEKLTFDLRVNPLI